MISIKHTLRHSTIKHMITKVSHKQAQILQQESNKQTIKANDQSSKAGDVYYTTFFLQTRVGPPSAEFCRTVANFPQMDDLRFINPWEAQDEDGLSQTTLQPNTRNLLCPNTPNTMANCIGALVRRRDGDTSAIWMVDIGFCNLKI